MKTVSTLILLAGTATFAFGGFPVPEIDANSAVAAVALVSGGLLVLRGRRRKQPPYGAK
jgi:hypothetical protein